MPTKKTQKFTIGAIKTGATIGVGSAVLGGLGSKAGVSVAGPLATVSSFASPLITIGMGMHTIDMVKKLQPKKRRRKR